MLIGIHISGGGSLLSGLLKAESLKCETYQTFITNPRAWSFKIRPQEEVEQFKKAKEKSEIKQIFAHSIYLINLATSDEYLYEKSIESLISSINICERAGFTGLITHIGSSKGEDTGDVPRRVIRAVSSVLESTKSQTKLILETDAGSGFHHGSVFEELGTIVKGVASNSLGICLDTCHSFASGYDFSDTNKVTQVLEQFDKKIGLNKLTVMHLNDSKGGLGSKLDRHEVIGEGKIGVEGFRALLHNPLLNNTPGILETPDLKLQDAGSVQSFEMLKYLRSKEK